MTDTNGMDYNEMLGSLHAPLCDNDATLELLIDGICATPYHDGWGVGHGSTGSGEVARGGCAPAVLDW